MGIFKRIFGGDGGAVGKIANIVDDLHLSGEEKLEADRKTLQLRLDALSQWMESTKGQNLARRFLAILFSISFIILVFAHAATAIIFDPSNAVAILGNTITELDTMVTLILAFYFAAPHMGKLADGIMEKWRKK